MVRVKKEIVICGCEIRSAKKYQEKYQCVSCLKFFCGRHVGTKVDGNNIAITRQYSKQPKCKECFKY